MVVNERRGEVAIKLGSKEFAVVLSTGALTALESAFGVEFFEDALKFERVSAAKLSKAFKTVLAAEGNEIDISEPEIARDIARMPVGKMLGLMNKLATLAGLVGVDDAEEESAAQRPLAAKKGGRSG